MQILCYKGLRIIRRYSFPIHFHFCFLAGYSLSDTTEDIRYEIRSMRRSDLPSLYALLAENKWNMEMSYLECVFNTDPTGLVVVVKDNGEVIGQYRRDR